MAAMRPPAEIITMRLGPDFFVAQEDSGNAGQFEQSAHRLIADTFFPGPRQPSSVQNADEQDVSSKTLLWGLGAAGIALGFAGWAVLRSRNVRTLSSLSRLTAETSGTARWFADLKSAATLGRIEKTAPELIHDGNALAQYVRESRPEIQAAIDEVVPTHVRTMLANRSPMYSPEQAKKFAADLERAFPNIDGAIQSELKLVRSAQEAEWLKLEAAKGRSGLRSAGGEFPQSAYSKAIPNSPAIERLERELARIQTAVKPVIDSVAKDQGFPAPVFRFSPGANTTRRGAWSANKNTISVNPHNLTKTGDFATTAYHELTHAEQTHLVTRNLADSLSIPVNATPEQKALLLKSYKEVFHIDDRTIEYRALNHSRLEEYISESLRLRAGVQLTPQQSQRAADLIKSWHHSYRPGAGANSYYKSMEYYLRGQPNLTDRSRSHLLYRSSLHEIEAWEAGFLV